MKQVILVGAGPGDKGLLTLRGAAALRNAEVVVYDRLVGAEILEMMPESAEKIDVGKENNHHPVPQEQINEILVRKAREGKTVIRLKGGDCYLFGRGGEEVEALHAAGIPFVVVPGVTSAFAAPAYAGIPVTHRDFCSSVHVITAHAKRGSEVKIDFEALVRVGGTLVFLMGVGALASLMEGLQRAGMRADMPAAVVENGTRADERKLVATVGTLTEQARAMDLHSPAVIVVGEVCALSDTHDWFTVLPLHGKSVIVTRPKARAGTLSGRLRALGAEVMEYPCIETIPRGNAALPEGKFSWVVLTSPAGVDALWQALLRSGRDMRALYGCRFGCIGAGTARELAKYGICADFVPAHYDGKHLAEGLAARLTADDRVLLARASDGTPELPEILSAHGISFFDWASYETVYRAEKLAVQEADFLAFTSASTVHGFLAAAPEFARAHVTAVCIGEVTAKAAKPYFTHIKTAKNATIDAMLACILEGE